MLKLRINEIIYPSKKNSCYVYVVHIVYFVKISIAMLRPDLMAMLEKWRYHTITQGISRMKLSPSIKNTTADQFTTKNTRSSVECWDHCDKTKAIR